MLVRLLADVIEYDRHNESVGIKSSKRRNKAWGPPMVVYNTLVSSKEPEFIEVRWTKGAVIEMSGVSAQKYIESGKGEAA